MHQDPRMVVSGRLANAETVRCKVEQDIAFLTDRIAALNEHPRPNQVVIHIYESMLESRRSVLKWLQHGRPEAVEHQAARSA